MNNFLRCASLVLLLPLFAGCGAAEQAQDPAPTVLVEVVGQGQSEQAFAGEVRAHQESALSFQVPGRLVKRHVDAGQQVKAGQLLAELDMADYALQAQAAQAQLSAAQAELARTRDELARYQALAGQQLVSRSALQAQQAAHTAAQAQVDAARANGEVARNQAGYAQLRAPADGVIASRQVEAGQVVAAGQTVMVLAAANGREVLFALPEAQLADFSLGQAVQVSLWSAPGKRLDGRLVEIAAEADRQARTFAARVALDSADAAQVALGQSARVHVARAGARLSVPLAAVQGQTGKAQGQVLLVDPATGTVAAASVQVARWGAERAELAAGLTPGQWVVAAGGHLLREGQQVRAVDRENRPLPGAVAPAASTDGN